MAIWQSTPFSVKPKYPAFCSISHSIPVVGYNIPIHRCLNTNYPREKKKHIDWNPIIQVSFSKICCIVSMVLRCLSREDLSLATPVRSSMWTPSSMMSLMAWRRVGVVGPTSHCKLYIYDMIYIYMCIYIYILYIYTMYMYCIYNVC
jgi:hypothetical protein